MEDHHLRQAWGAGSPPGRSPGTRTAIAGASIAAQALEPGLIDEVIISLAPVLL
ncbi:MAG: hypothetical protein WAK82_04965 [Streptosporangiaceae bacterium]